MDTYFIDNNLQNSGNWKLYFKGSVLLLSAASIYFILLFFTPGNFLAIVLCCLLGFNLAAIGFNIMHEGGHQSFSKNKTLNNIAAYSLNMMGGNIHFWKQKHNISHHTYTNIEGMDHDIEIKFMRVHKDQPKYWFHKFQHVYWVILYGISYLAWVLFQDFEKYFRGRMGKISEKKPMNIKEHVIFWLTKILYIGAYVILPIILLGWLPAVIGFLTVCIVCGFSISIVFQLAHVVESTQFTSPNGQDSKIEQGWAVHQISTTSNFATNSKAISWFLGGLNFQVEHHLFPRISHIHYPKINQLVKETCEEFNLRYLEHSTLTKAFLSHLTHIKKLGYA